MAAVKISGQQTITFAAAITLIQLIAATNIKVILREIGVSFDGISNTETPIDVQLVRQTDAGTMSALTLVNFDTDDGTTIQTTGQHTATAEPTTTDILESWYVHPQSGIVVPFYFDKEVIMAGGERLALKIGTVPDGSTNVNCYMVAEE